MGKFRKKPVVIEARQFTEDAGWMDIYRWIERNTLGSFEPTAVLEGRVPCPASGVSIDPDTGELLIATLEGVMRVSVGDWVIQGVAGEFYPCKPEIFAATYEDPEPIESIVAPFDALVEEGLLWLINAEVFHPRGYAMALHYSNGRIDGWALLGDGTEPFTFDHDLAKEKFEAVTRYFRERDPNRP